MNESLHPEGAGTGHNQRGAAQAQHPDAVIRAGGVLVDLHEVASRKLARRHVSAEGDCGTSGHHNISGGRGGRRGCKDYGLCHGYSSVSMSGCIELDTTDACALMRAVSMAVWWAIWAFCRSTCIAISAL